ncbi:MAG TPA: hypothetical protein VFB94_06405 [Acidimicrobiales bacterium]|jgi:hypothetical protein|nr:hypothetical protein [Acidimicrobiales bacterium]
MKFKTGLVLGLAAGYWFASQSNEQRKAQLDQLVARVREDPRVQRVSDAVEHRVRDVTDRTSETVADKLEPEGATASSNASASSKPGNRSA